MKDKENLSRKKREEYFKQREQNMIENKWKHEKEGTVIRIRRVWVVEEEKVKKREKRIWRNLLGRCAMDFLLHLI